MADQRRTRGSSSRNRGNAAGTDRQQNREPASRKKSSKKSSTALSRNARRTGARDNIRPIKQYRAFRVNSALIIFGVILIYVVASVIVSLNKSPIATYKVNASNINNNIVCDGIALRDEKKIYTGKTGYVCYFVREGERVAKNSPICTIDETGTLLQSVSMVPEGTSIFKASDYMEIRKTIDTFKTGYSDTSFYNVYTFKGSIENKVLEMSNQILMKEYRNQGTAMQSTISNMQAPESGILTYYVDGFEELTPDQLNADSFDQTQYKREILKAGEIIEAGNPVYKIISNEEWSVCCKITVDQANTLLDEEKLLYTINNSDIQMASHYDLIQKDGFFILQLPMNRYMIDYVEDRFLSVEIILDDFAGLKVPNSALLDKEVYQVPKEYFTAGGNENGVNKLYIRAVDENGESTVKQVEPDIFRHEGDVYYVAMEDIPDDAVLIKPDSNDTLAASTLDRAKLKGVYLANRGIADFIEISIVREGDEFTIVSDKNGLREFDNIVMDAMDIHENQILY